MLIVVICVLTAVFIVCVRHIAAVAAVARCACTSVCGVYVPFCAAWLQSQWQCLRLRRRSQRGSPRTAVTRCARCLSAIRPGHVRQPERCDYVG